MRYVPMISHWQRGCDSSNVTPTLTRITRRGINRGIPRDDTITVDLDIDESKF